MILFTLTKDANPIWGDYHKNPDTLCSAYRVMLNFEKAHPDIAKKYFDLRFDEENQYSNKGDEK